MSEHEENYLKSNETDFEELDAETIQAVKEELGYFISKDDLYSTWIKNINESKWSIIKVTDALTHFRENIYKSSKRDFEGIFEDVNLTSEKLGSNSKEKESAIRRLLELLASVDIIGNKVYDTFGFIYEYLIAQFAMSSGKKAGEFYTPHEVSRIMAAVVAKHLKTKTFSKVYDPTVGSGSLLLTVRDATNEYVENNNIMFYGQENNSTTYNIARMNLLMRGVKPANMNIKNGDTLKDDWPNGMVEGQNDPLFVDVVVANPPYSQKWDSNESQLKDSRFRDYGVAPGTKADYAFLLHSLYHLEVDGVMAIVLPHGVLFRGNEEERIRTKLLMRGQVDAIIGLPAGIFTNTGIPTIIMVLNKTKKHDNVLIIDGSKGFKKEKSSNTLRERDIKKILDTYDKRAEVKGFSHLASLNEIKENGYNLNIPRYVNSNEQVQEQNIEGHLLGGIPENDINQFQLFWDKFPKIRLKLVTPLRKDFVTLNVNANEVLETIQTDNDYIDFVTQMNENINVWGKCFINKTIENVLKNNSKDIFKMLEDELFKQFSTSIFTDPYEAYQLFADQWNEVVEADIEMIKLDGFEKAKELEPNMVVKIKGGKKEEVQEGLKGCILSKYLIIKAFFKDELNNLENDESELSHLESRQVEIMEEINEEFVLYDFVNDKDKLDATSYKKIKTKMTELKKAKDKINYTTLEEVYETNEKIKSFRISIKNQREELDKLAEQQYPKLTIKQIKQLLEQKWLDKLIVDLNHIIDSYSRKVSTTINELDKHYSNTLSQIQDKRKQSENIFWDMAKLLVRGDV